MHVPAQHAVHAVGAHAQGVLPGELRQTCTACATTLLLEFGTLSRLTGDAKYERVAAHAVGIPVPHGFVLATRGSTGLCTLSSRLSRGCILCSVGWRSSLQTFRGDASVMLAAEGAVHSRTA